MRLVSSWELYTDNLDIIKFLYQKRMAVILRKHHTSQMC